MLALKSISSAAGTPVLARHGLDVSAVDGRHQMSHANTTDRAMTTLTNDAAATTRHAARADATVGDCPSAPNAGFTTGTPS